MDPHFLYLKKRKSNVALSINIFKHLQTSLNIFKHCNSYEIPSSSTLVPILNQKFKDIDSTNVLEPAQFSHYDLPPSSFFQS